MDARQFVKRNASKILTGLSIVGIVATTITAVKATPKALRLMEEAEKKKGDELTKWEKTQVAAPIYIPTIGIGVTTIICIFCAETLNQRQQAALTSAYALLDQSYKKYKEKLIVIRKDYKCFYGKEMKVMKLKIDGAKALSIGVTVLGIVGALLSSKVESNNRKAMKSELKEELMKELNTK